MDVLPLPAVNAADAARAAALKARAAKAALGPGFGAALDAAMKPADRFAPRAPGSTPASRAEAAREDDDRDAANQVAMWMTAAREARIVEKRRSQSRQDAVDAADTAAGRRADRALAEKRAAANTATERRGAGREVNRSAADQGVREAKPAARDATPVAREGDTAARATSSAETTAARGPATAGGHAAAGESRGAETGAADGAGATDAPRDVRAVERSLESLDPEFRARLERVIERMENELGHDVTVAETHRDADRQSYLFEQGRTRPGPVVTWTRSSNHTRGMAADIVVDGSYDNPAGYAQLARIAAEEGLQTLGTRDPGHVEMATSDARARAQAARSTAPAGYGMAQVAQVAQVARVAQPAQVAQVARVAQPGSGPAAALPAESIESADTVAADGAALRTASAVREAARGFAATAVRAFSEGGEASDERAADTGTTGAEAELFSVGSSATTRAGDKAPFTLAAGAAGRTQTTGVSAPSLRADVSGRMERVQALQEAVAGQPLSQVSLSLEGEDGSATRVHVGLRGSAVGASIDTPDAVTAASLRAHVAELRQALEQQGLDPSSLLVRAAARLPEGTDASRLVAALAKPEQAAGGAGANLARESGSERDSSGSQTQNHAARRDADANRQRQSRNGKENRP